MRWVLSSGAKWFATASEDLRRLAPGARFAEFYGASELSFVAVRKCEEDCPESSVGRAFSNVTITIRRNDGAVAPPFEVGRVFVRSPYLFSGYATQEDPLARFGEEMSVGDFGFLDAKGYLHLVGRSDRMIVTSGKNVFAEEVERAIEKAPGVRACAVFGVPDPVRGQMIVALICPDGARLRVARTLFATCASNFRWPLFHASSASFPNGDGPLPASPTSGASRGVGRRTVGRDSMTDAYIIAALRTPVAPRNGAFRSCEVSDLAAPVLSALLRNTGVSGASIDDVILGNALYAGVIPRALLRLLQPCRPQRPQ